MDTNQIYRSINGCSVLLRFLSDDNEQVLTVVKDLMVKSYAEKLFR